MSFDRNLVNFETPACLKNKWQVEFVWVHLQLSVVGKGVSGETVKRSDDGPSVVSYAEAVKGKQYVIE